MNYLLILLTGLGALRATAVHAADLKAPMELESAQVLPAGVRNPRFKNLFMSIDSRFNGLGHTEPLGNKLNKEVSWSNLIAKQETDADREKLLGLLKASGIDPALGGPGVATGQVNTLVKASVPVLAFGVTDRLTLALAVPVMTIDVNADTGFVGNESGDLFINNLCESDPVKCNEVKSKLAVATNQKLTDLGYRTVGPHRVQGIGDVKVVGKYLFSQDERNSITFKSELTLPTGTPPNSDKALDVPTGDGQFDLGGMVIWDSRLTENIQFNTFFGYTIQIADKIERRIPDSQDSLSSIKELLDRNLGDLISSGAGLSYLYRQAGLTIGTGYNLQHQAQTTYKDGVHESYRYRLLELDAPQQVAHSLIFSAGFSTVEWFKTNKFALPLQANLAYSRPFAGKNITKNDVFTAELVLFF